jgi:basic amino acid/polyamine antiporter, APA family
MTDSDAPLTQAIRLPHATAMVVGTIIGASIFVQPSQVTGQVPSFAGAALVWILAGALTMMGALVTAELSSTIPRTGGVYVYLREAFGPLLGFLWGWAMFWTMHSGIIAAIAMVVASYVAFLVELGPVGERAVAIAAIVSLSWVNWLGVRHGSTLQTAITFAKVAVIVLMVAVGFALGGPGGAGAGMTEGAAGAAGGGTGDGLAGGAAVGGGPLGDGLLGGGGLSGLLSGLAAGLFAFGGWHMVTYNAGETVDAERTIPRSLVLGVAVVTACYVALNAVYFWVLPMEAVIASERIAADAAEAVLGFGAGAAITGLVVFSAFGALAGIVLAGPRVYYAMARDGLVFRWLGGLHPVRRTPHRAIALQAVWSSVLVATGTYRELFTRVIYTEWIFFGLMALGLVVFRRRGLPRSYASPAFPVLPVAFALAAFAVAVHEVVANPVDSALGLGMVAVGAPVFYLWSRYAAPARDIHRQRAPDPHPGVDPPEGVDPSRGAIE